MYTKDLKLITWCFSTLMFDLCMVLDMSGLLNTVHEDVTGLMIAYKHCVYKSFSSTYLVLESLGQKPRRVCVVNLEIDWFCRGNLEELLIYRFL